MTTGFFLTGFRSQEIQMYRIAVASPDVATRDGISDPLRSAGYDVHAIDDGGALLQYVERDGVHLVVLDLRLSDGLELCKRIKTRFDVPVVVAAPNPSFELKFEALRSRADDFFEIPLNETELLRRTRVLLGKAAQLLGKLIIVWDPAAVSSEDYSTVVEAVGDLVRGEGGLGIERVWEQGFSVPASENTLV